MTEKPTLDAILIPPPELEDSWNEIPEIVKIGDPVLRKVATPVRKCTKETLELIQKMIKAMRKAHGLGLAAPQVGVSQRIFIYQVNQKSDLNVLINPTVTNHHGEQLEPAEGCLSMPGLQGTVPRAQEVRLKGYDERGRPISKRASGLEARIIQHEFDHLNGILFTDRADPETLVWLLDDDETLEAV